MSLKIDVDRAGPDEAAITLTGELNSATAAACDKELTTVLAPELKTLILNLKHLKYISSAGLRLVLKARKQLEKQGGRLALRHMSAPVAKVFEIAALIPPDVQASRRSEDIFLDAVQRREAVRHHDISD
ncbi:MAG: STAS domain-containing protein [Kiritimatiellia bacterium]|nr:STAS domain-containing protein [Lentisphaerota bacterium]